MEDGIRATSAAFVCALERGDAAAAAALYTADARLVPPSAGLVEGREAIERFWKAGIDSGITAVDLDVLELVRGVGLAYEIGRYALWIDGGAEAAERGVYVLVHELRDGTWQRTVEMFNPESSQQ